MLAANNGILTNRHEANTNFGKRISFISYMLQNNPEFRPGYHAARLRLKTAIPIQASHANPQAEVSTEAQR